MTSSRCRLGQQECGLTSRTQNDGNCVEHILVSHVRRFRICSPECMFHFYPFFRQLSVGSVLNVHAAGFPRRVDEFTLCTCEIAEGRMHQIRLHMSSPRRNGEAVRGARGVGDPTNVTNQGRQRWAHPLSRNSTTKKPSR